MAVTFPNPDTIEVHFAQLHQGGQIGDIEEAARAAGVKPVTIRVWVNRGKVEPIVRGDGRDLFHIPTIIEASKSRPGRRWHTTATAA
ncbi:MerR family transcriptional regulator [Actinacidiphila acididurans]|uniref:MerR family transcriptional regulator n=1 Tax=Actinacidiphila acididurans TaxID=2784346 RepID=A0ABS2U2Z8_9ACTN|nr:MerR family transcriptional regulator [Actinacidiphila acididurans]MBM9509974.1 MerR family transcriptional regulator [Actinacidiphila acididurans]